MICLTDGSRFARELGGSVPAGDRSPFWSRLILVAHASHSHFTAFADAADSGWIPPGPVAAVAGTCPELRGFHGRTWASCPGNLHLAAAIPLHNCDADAALRLVLVPALAARDAIAAASAGALSPRIKWVNDVCLGTGKAAGVLTRTAILEHRADVLIIGIGINVRSAPSIPRTPFVPRAVAADGVGLADVLRETLAAIERRCRQATAHGRAAIMDDYRAASNVVGRRVRIYADTIAEYAPPAEWPAPVAAGLVREIRDDLALVIDGARAPVANGRLAFEEDCREFGLREV